MRDKLLGFIPRPTIDNPNHAENKIEKDAFLKYIYEYQLNIIRALCAELKSDGDIVEIGAAGGITKSIWHEVVTTDVREAAGVDKIVTAERLIFKDSSIKCLFGMDALHHLRDPYKHFQEVDRCLVKGGMAVYIEPNWNQFSKFSFGVALKYLHPEPYDLKQQNWQITGDNPMMGNQAQAHNIFVRDRKIFENSFPQLRIQILESVKGLSFLISGGVHTRLPISSKILIPAFKMESRHNKWMASFGLGRVITLTKI